MPVLSPPAKQQFLDNAGNIAAGFKLYTYSAGTTNLLPTYQDRAGAALNTNPIILDSRGEATLYLAEGKSYDLVLEGTDGSLIWTQQGVDSYVGSVQAAALGDSVTAALASVASTSATLNTRMDSVVAGQTADMLGYDTKAAMDAVTTRPINSLALVTNDPTPANNGTYRYSGSAWVLSADRVTGLESRAATLEQGTFTGLGLWFSATLDGSAFAITDGIRKPFYIGWDASVNVPKLVSLSASVETLSPKTISYTSGTVVEDSTAALTVSGAGSKVALRVGNDGSVDLPASALSQFRFSQRAANATHLVECRRRSETDTSRYLVAVNISTGAETVIGSTAGWDYTDPAIIGSKVAYTRTRGTYSVRASVPLSGGTEAPITSTTDLHMLGDSFTTPALQSAILAGRTTIAGFSTDGVGGSNLTQQLARFTATPQYHDRTLIIMDGGLNTEDYSTAPATIASMIALLTPAVKRWCYVEPSPLDTIKNGTPERVTWDATVAAIKAAFPDNFVDTLAFMQSKNDGSANDLQDVADGLVPRSLRTDAIHENATGSQWRALCINNFLTSKGW